MGKILPILIIVLGIGIGGGVGFFLKPEAASEVSDEHADDTHGEEKSNDHGAAKDDHGAAKDSHGAKPEKKKKESSGGHGGGHGEKSSTTEYLEFRRQFVIPVIRQNGVKSLMVLDLTIELKPGSASNAYSYEPKLRAAFLETLFRLSHTGLFSSELTDPRVRDTLQAELRDTAQTILGDTAVDVLVLGVLRQDV